MTGFDLQAALEDVGWWEEGEGEDLYVCFSGLPGDFGRPVFEFQKTMQAIPGRKLFLRDVHQLWYLGGLNDEIDSWKKLAAFLFGRAIGKTGTAPRITTIGMSSGGFAALFFGYLIGADHVRAFGPQTFLDESTRAQYGEARWELWLQNLYKHVGSQNSELNLASFCRKGFRDARIYICEGCEADWSHVRNMESIPGIRLVVVPGDRHPDCTGPGCIETCQGHNVAGALKREGRLDAAIRGEP